MKKFLLIIQAALLTCLVSCNSDKSSSENKSDTRAEKNLAAENGVNKAIESGDFSKLGDYIAADGIDHAGDKGDTRGLDSIKAHLSMLHSICKDMKMETIKELADSEYVFQWMRFTGTSDGGMGMPKGPFDMKAVEVSKFNKDSKCTEHWEFMQPADMMKMMPMPSVAAPEKK